MSAGRSLWRALSRGFFVGGFRDTHRIWTTKYQGSTTTLRRSVFTCGEIFATSPTRCSRCERFVRALGRKIIFTTNLPNIGDIDEALVRPGRCFAVLRTRSLEHGEAQSLVTKLCGGNAMLCAAVVAALPSDGRAVSLASVFRAVDAQSKPAQACGGISGNDGASAGGRSQLGARDV
jgi:hypothetical protein